MKARSLVTWVLALVIACGADTEEDDGTVGPRPGEGSSSGGGPSDGDAGTAETLDDFFLDFSTGVVGARVLTIPDGSGHHLDATASGAVLFAEGHPAGVVGVAFDGKGVLTAAHRDVAKLDFGPTEPFTIEIGFMTTAHGRDAEAGAGVLLERRGAFEIAVVDGRLVVTLSGKSPIVLRPRTVSDGHFHRVIVTRDEKSVIRISLDGDAAIETTDGAVALRGEPALAFGAGFYGVLDHVRVRRRTTAPFNLRTGPARASIFAAGAEPHPSGGTYASIRIPAIVTAGDGSLLVVAEGRVDDACDLGDIDVVAKRSTDGGKTWSKIQRVIANPKGKAGNPIPFWDDVKKRLVLMTSFTDTQPDGAGCAASVPNSAKVKVQTSADFGVTWSAPIDVTAQTTDPAWNLGGLIGPSHGIQLRSGANAGALVVHAMHRRDGDNLRGGHLLVSRDGGATWKVAAKENTSAPAVNVNESTVAELPDGRLYVNVRHQSDDVEADRPKGLRGEAFIGADLAYVGAPPFRRTAAFRGPVVHGTTLRWVGSERYGDEPRILFSFPAGETGTNFGVRHDLRLYASRDGAKAFAPSLRIVGGKASYSDMTPLDDGRIGLIVETADDGTTYNQRIDFYSVAVQHLDDPVVLAWTFEGDGNGKISSGIHPVPLVVEGSTPTVPGRWHSKAAQFDGSSRACASVASLAHVADLDVNDGVAIDVSFRTTAHGGAEAGTLVAKSAVGTPSAFWLRVEQGRVRFAVGDDTGTLDVVASKRVVDDGQFHHVRAVRDPAKKRLLLDVDGDVTTTPLTTTGVVTNGERLCLGAFAGPDVPRAFVGDIDDVVVRLLR